MLESFFQQSPTYLKRNIKEYNEIRILAIFTYESNKSNLVSIDYELDLDRTILNLQNNW